MQILINFHHDSLPNNELIDKNFVEYLFLKNYSIIVKKSSHQYMSRPYGNCHDYRVPQDTTYHAMSYIQCYRKCLAHQYIDKFNCIPYLIDNFITEYDLINNETKRCSTNREDVMYRRLGENVFVEKCTKICPKECFRVEYFSEVKRREIFFDNQKWVNKEMFDRAYERMIVWDSSQPMFAYIDEPVMTFTQYLVFCGGLMGLWFGQSFKDLFSLLIDKSFWYKYYHQILIIFRLIYKLIINILKNIMEFSILVLKLTFQKFKKIVSTLKCK